ncbi:MAG: LysR family transcriptional regulator [Pseudonocardiaceae bacterium]
MTAARMHALVAVADTGSVRSAAERLVVTDSAVSAALTALSRDLGVPVVERAGRGLRLTPSGQTYAGYARRVLGLLEEGRAAARGEQDPNRGRLRLAAVTTAGDHLLPTLLTSFRERHPLVGLALEVAPSDEVWNLLYTHAADLVIAGRPRPGVEARVVATRANQLIVVAAPDVAAGFDWSSTPWLLREQGSGTRATLEAYLVARQAQPPRLVLGSNGAVIAGAVAGLGATLVSQDAVADLLDARRLTRVGAPGTPMRRPWHAVTGSTATATTRLFVEHLHASGWRYPAASW